MNMERTLFFFFLFNFFNCSIYLSLSCCRLQRPNVFLPVHLYGQLVHDKTGCLLLEAQVPDYAHATCCHSIALCVFVDLFVNLCIC